PTFIHSFPTRRSSDLNPGSVLYVARNMEKGCFKVLMVASQPARQRSARRNQRSFWFLARLTERRPRPGSATFFAPSFFASRSFLGVKKPRAALGSSGAP